MNTLRSIVNLNTEIKMFEILLQGLVYKWEWKWAIEKIWMNIFFIVPPSLMSTSNEWVNDICLSNSILNHIFIHQTKVSGNLFPNRMNVDLVTKRKICKAMVKVHFVHENWNIYINTVIINQVFEMYKNTRGKIL